MKYLTKNKYWRLIEEYNIDKLLYLLIDKPNYIDGHGFIWKNNKELYHRDYDLPAYTINDSNSIRLYWDISGSLHRDNNKPAYINHKGHKECWLNDKFIRNEIFNKK